MTTDVLRAGGAASARDLAVKLGAALAFAGLTAAAAQVRIPLPFTPVPITAQTAVVLLSGAVLGAGWGVTSMGLYLLAGVLGAPVFAGGAAGPAAVLGPTGGYLLAFLLVPIVVGTALDHQAGVARRFLVFLAASGIILLWGMLQLALAMELSLGRAFILGVAPFLAGDLVKVAVAALAFRALRKPSRRLRN